MPDLPQAAWKWEDGRVVIGAATRIDRVSVQGLVGHVSWQEVEPLVLVARPGKRPVGGRESGYSPLTPIPSCGIPSALSVEYITCASPH
jgi:hypothetical protein